MHWMNKYLTKDWTATYDCFAHFAEVQQNHFGVDTFNRLQNMPKVLQYEAADKYARNSDEVAEFWETVKEPQDGDAMIFNSGPFKFHIGTYLDVDGGGVLHCEHGRGVVFTQMKVFRQMKMKDTLILRHKGE